ncbi:XRE family transcriptional regulator [Polaromonas sp. SP1]|nr:XRE family transcriptional regulator [Polaromonas sp. SP1]QGJ20765.1 helix-turn-helix domain-containing protein [Polaromonas sp. Pch-P]
MHGKDIGVIFGEVLRVHRMAAGISQEELAFRSDVDRTYVSRLERGTRQPTITTMINIGAALGIPAAVLMQDVEERYLESIKATGRG